MKIELVNLLTNLAQIIDSNTLSQELTGFEKEQRDFISKMLDQHYNSIDSLGQSDAAVHESAPCIKDFRLARECYLKYAEGGEPIYGAAYESIYRLASALIEANNQCRTAYQIAARYGEGTNWENYDKALTASLNRQHEVMYPKDL